MCPRLVQPRSPGFARDSQAADNSHRPEIEPTGLVNRENPDLRPEKVAGQIAIPRFFQRVRLSWISLFQPFAQLAPGLPG